MIRRREGALWVVLLSSVWLVSSCGGGSKSTTTPPPTNEPAVSLSVSSLTFKDQVISTTSSVSTVTLTNSGNAALSITGISVTGTNSSDFAQSNTCGTSVAAAANCTINVTFTPSAAGSRTASVAIADNASGSPQTVSLTGTGVVALAISTTSLSAATVGSGYSTTLVATGGTTPYTWSISSSALPAGLTLAPSTGVISGAPTSAGTYDFSVEVTDSGNPAQTATQPLSLVVNSLTVSVGLTPGTPATGTLTANGTSTLNFSFPANAVTQASTVTLTPMGSSDLPLALSSGTTFVAAFGLAVSPAISSFGAAVGLSGNVDPTISSGTTLQLAMFQDPPAASSPAARARWRRTALEPMTTGSQWIVVSTLVVGLNGSLTQNLATTDLPGIIGPGQYVLFIPAPGTTIVSNFGVVLMGDDGMGTGNCADALQVIYLYDAQGNPLATPAINCLSYSGASDLDGTALTPDGSQGVMVDGGNTVRFFSGLQTGTVTASTNTVDVSAYGGDGDSIAIMPNGDEAVVSADGTCASGLTCLLLVSGIVSGNPKPAITITVPDLRDGVVISNDGQELLARGPSGLTVFAIAPVTPYTGSEGGTASHSFTQIIDLSALGSQGNMEDGRDGMAISPVDSSRAVVITSSGALQLVTGLPSNPQVAASASITPSVSSPMSVSITPDGTTAIVGGFTGVSMIAGVDTGTLAEVGTVYSPTYTSSGSSVSLSLVSTLAITLDGKYVAACDEENSALLVIPITSSGFGTPVGVITGIAPPANDQMVVH